jgi:PEP-CTERM motif
MKTTHPLAALAVTLAGLGAAAATPARAASLTQLLVPGASITSDGLVFDNFSYTPTGQMPGADAVTVNPIVDALGNPGIRITGAFTDAPGDSGSDALLTYRVTSLGALLTDAHLFGNPLVVGGPGAIAVVETLDLLAVRQMAIFDNQLVGGTRATQTSDAVTFAPVRSINPVLKDIEGFSQGGFPTLSFVDQTYSTAAVPEPSSVVVLGTGVVGMLGALWRRRRAA